MDMDADGAEALRPPLALSETGHGACFLLADGCAENFTVDEGGASGGRIAEGAAHTAACEWRAGSGA